VMILRNEKIYIYLQYRVFELKNIIEEMKKEKTEREENKR